MMRLAGAALAVVFAAACQCQVRIVQPATPTPHDIVGLLKDPETGAVGRVVVSSTSGGSVELTHKREATRIAKPQSDLSGQLYEQDNSQRRCQSLRKIPRRWQAQAWKPLPPIPTSGA